jgi:hypothetical protein
MHHQYYSVYYFKTKAHSGAGNERTDSPPSPLLFAGLFSLFPLIEMYSRICKGLEGKVQPEQTGTRAQASQPWALSDLKDKLKSEMGSCTSQ